MKHLENNVNDDETLYRGVNRKLPDNIRIGTKFYFREFISTSKSELVGKIYAEKGTLFIIKIKNNGTNGHPKYCLNITNFSNHPDEEEILISCHCFFSITDIKKGEYNDVAEGNYDIVYLDCEGNKFN